MFRLSTLGEFARSPSEFTLGVAALTIIGALMLRALGHLALTVYLTFKEPEWVTVWRLRRQVRRRR